MKDGSCHLTFRSAAFLCAINFMDQSKCQKCPCVLLIHISTQMCFYKSEQKKYFLLCRGRTYRYGVFLQLNILCMYARVQIFNSRFCVSNVNLLTCDLTHLKKPNKCFFYSFYVLFPVFVAALN